MSDTAKSDSDYALIVHTEGQQPVLLRYLMLILNCRFRLSHVSLALGQHTYQDEDTGVDEPPRRPLCVNEGVSE